MMTRTPMTKQKLERSEAVKGVNALKRVTTFRNLRTMERRNSEKVKKEHIRVGTILEHSDLK